MISDDEIYIVVDIEADGPVPGLYSMLSLGAVATTAEEEISTFYRTIQPLENAGQHEIQMKWWRTQPGAWKEVTKNIQNPETVVKEFLEWVKSFNKKPVFVAHPVGYDYMFVRWYLWKFVNEDPFTNETGAPQTLDIRSFVSGRFSYMLKDSSRSKLPESFLEGAPEHSHHALDDAKIVAAILRNSLR